MFSCAPWCCRPDSCYLEWKNILEQGWIGIKFIKLQLEIFHDLFISWSTLLNIVIIQSSYTTYQAATTFPTPPILYLPLPSHWPTCILYFLGWNSHKIWYVSCAQNGTVFSSHFDYFIFFTVPKNKANSAALYFPLSLWPCPTLSKYTRLLVAAQAHLILWLSPDFS